MPFKSLAQIRACFAANDPSWDCHAWAKHTPSIKKLPERKPDESKQAAQSTEEEPPQPLFNLPTTSTRAPLYEPPKILLRARKPTLQTLLRPMTNWLTPPIPQPVANESTGAASKKAFTPLSAPAVDEKAAQAGKAGFFLAMLEGSAGQTPAQAQPDADNPTAPGLLPQGSRESDRASESTASSPSTSKQAAGEELVHYSRNRHDELRPLSYDELLTDRTSGRWANDPAQAKEYVQARKRMESALHRRLQQRGIATDRNNSFLYATLAGREQFGQPGQYRHSAPLSDDITNSSFFDVVGDGKGRTMFGAKGLLAALKRWQAAEQAGTLKEEEYMGMPIRPRIEVMTPRSVKPERAEKQAEVHPGRALYDCPFCGGEFHNGPPDDMSRAYRGSGQCADCGKSCSIVGSNLKSREKQAADPEVVIDRPKGFKKTFRTSTGLREVVYPLDYGYFKGVVNPQDNEDADVFVGSGGPRYGRFMKGDLTTGEWQPDEHKWYSGLSDEELSLLKNWWELKEYGGEPGLTRDWTTLSDRTALLGDLPHEKQAFGWARAMAGLKPGQPWRPFASTAKMLFMPEIPYLSQKAPLVAKGLRYGSLATTAGSGAVGLGETVARAAELPGEIAYETLRGLDVGMIPASYYREQIKAEGFRPGLAMLTDPTPVGEAARDYAGRMLLPTLQGGMHRFRQERPLLSLARDTLGSLSPFGAAMTGLRHGLSKEMDSALPRQVAQEVMAKHGPALKNMDKMQLLRSPLAQTAVAPLADKTTRDSFLEWGRQEGKQRLGKEWTAFKQRLGLDQLDWRHAAGAAGVGAGLLGLLWWLRQRAARKKEEEANSGGAARIEKQAAGLLKGLGFLGRALRSTGREMAGLKPGQPWQPVASTAKAIFAPEIPWLARKAPRIAKGLRLGAAAASAQAAGTSALDSLDRYRDAMQVLPNTIEQSSLPAGVKAPLHSLAAGMKPNPLALAQAAWQDPTPLGETARDFAGRSAVPSIRHGLYAFPRKHPIIGGLRDALSSLSPFGAAMTGMRHGLAKPYTPQEAHTTLKDTVKDHAPDLIQRAPELKHSPLLGSFRKQNADAKEGAMTTDELMQIFHAAPLAIPPSQLLYLLKQAAEEGMDKEAFRRRRRGFGRPSFQPRPVAAAPARPPLTAPPAPLPPATVPVDHNESLSTFDTTLGGGEPALQAPPRPLAPLPPLLAKQGNEDSEPSDSYLEEDDANFRGVPQSMNKGWQWRYMNREADEGLKKWLPRLFQSEDTPVADLLADPKRQGILGGVAGAGLGAAGGAYLGNQLGGDLASAGLGGLAGLGAGGLLGALLGYSRRRRENDRILSAMRRMPPGATLADWELRQPKQADASAAPPLAKQSSLEKQALEQVKLPPTQVRQVMKGRRTTPGVVEQVLSDRPGKGPDLAKEKALADAMYAAAPHALSGVEVQLGAADPRRNWERAWANPRLGALGTLLALTKLPDALDGDSGVPATSPYYDPISDTVVQPWGSQGATMHELGHAKDFNDWGVPKNWFLRQPVNLARDLYMIGPGTLWKEHAAWRKGQNTFLEGALQKGMDPKAVGEVLQSQAKAKAPALGTYWGGAAGGLAGLALAIYLMRQGASGRVAGLAGGLTGMAGALGGLGIGAGLRGLSRNRAERLLADYKGKLQAKQKEQPREKTRAKAAAFYGELLGVPAEEMEKQAGKFDAGLKAIGRFGDDALQWGRSWLGGAEDAAKVVVPSRAAVSAGPKATQAGLWNWMDDAAKSQAGAAKPPIRVTPQEVAPKPAPAAQPPVLGAKDVVSGPATSAPNAIPVGTPYVPTQGPPPRVRTTPVGAQTMIMPPGAVDDALKAMPPGAPTGNLLQRFLGGVADWQPTYALQRGLTRLGVPSWLQTGALAPMRAATGEGAFSNLASALAGRGVWSGGKHGWKALGYGGAGLGLPLAAAGIDLAQGRTPDDIRGSLAAGRTGAGMAMMGPLGLAAVPGAGYLGNLGRYTGLLESGDPSQAGPAGLWKDISTPYQTAFGAGQIGAEMIGSPAARQRGLHGVEVVGSGLKDMAMAPVNAVLERSGLKAAPSHQDKLRVEQGLPSLQQEKRLQQANDFLASEREVLRLATASGDAKRIESAQRNINRAEAYLAQQAQHGQPTPQGDPSRSAGGFDADPNQPNISPAQLEQLEQGRQQDQQTITALAQKPNKTPQEQQQLQQAQQNYVKRSSQIAYHQARQAMPGLTPDQFAQGLSSPDPANPVNQHGGAAMGAAAASVLQQGGNLPVNPQDPGFMSQMTEWFSGLPGEHKAMMLGGLALTVFGVMSGLAGDGGMGAGLIAALGLGGLVAGFMGYGPSQLFGAAKGKAQQASQALGLTEAPQQPSWHGITPDTMRQQQRQSLNVAGLRQLAAANPDMAVQMVANYLKTDPQAAKDLERIQLLPPRMGRFTDGVYNDAARQMSDKFGQPVTVDDVVQLQKLWPRIQAQLPKG